MVSTLKILYFLFGVILSFPVFSGEQYGKVKEIIVRGSDGLHFFWLEGSSSAKPVCAKNTYWMIRDENSSAGKAQLAILLAAQAQQKPIKVVGSGSCTRWSDGEDVDYISVQ
jgi:hypothetical protein